MLTKSSRLEESTWKKSSASRPPSPTARHGRNVSTSRKVSEDFLGFLDEVVKTMGPAGVVVLAVKPQAGR